MDFERLYITFDIDWADDDVLTLILDLLDEHDCKATFFVTHRSAVIEQMSADSRLERGIHPNFSPLLAHGNNHSTDRSAARIIDELMSIVPEANSCRAHSLVTGTPLLRLCRERGLLIDSNVYIPWRQAATVRPWRFWTGSMIVPFVWSDYIDMLHHGDVRPDELLAARDTVKVIAFHPIHVYLNTPDLAYYTQFKESGLTAREARRMPRRHPPGVGDAFRRLLDSVRDHRFPTGLLSELGPRRDNDAAPAGRQSAPC
jgi:hypothetical protein